MKFVITTAIVTSLAFMATPAFAGEVEDAIIAKVVEGYGGDKFINMKSIKFTDTTYTGGGPGQGNVPGISPLNMQKTIAMFAPKDLRSSFEAYSSTDSFTNHNRTTYTPDGFVGIDYTSGLYQSEAAENYYQAIGPMIRSVDTMLAYELVRSPELAEAKSQINYLGRKHHVVTYNLPESPPLTLYVDDASGHITRMQRVTPFGNLEYIWSNFTSDDGVDYASDFQFFADGSLTTMSLRDADVNSVRSKDFAIDRGIELEPARFEFAEMSVDEVSDGIHMVGQNFGYSLFIDNGASIIGMGGYAGLDDRFKAYQEAAGHTKPLGTHIVTHHHADHIAGIPEAYALGAKLILTPDSVAPVKALIDGTVLDSRFEVLNEDKDIGPVKLLRVSTSHAAENIMPYVKSTKTVFQADHYGSPYPDQVGGVNGNGRVMKQALEAKGLEIEKMISAHGRKVENWDTFVDAAENTPPYKCYKGRKICR